MQAQPKKLCACGRAEVTRTVGWGVSSRAAHEHRKGVPVRRPAAPQPLAAPGRGGGGGRPASGCIRRRCCPALRLLSGQGRAWGARLVQGNLATCTPLRVRPAAQPGGSSTRVVAQRMELLRLSLCSRACKATAGEGLPAAARQAAHAAGAAVRMTQPQCLASAAHPAGRSARWRAWSPSHSHSRPAGQPRVLCHVCSSTARAQRRSAWPWAARRLVPVSQRRHSRWGAGRPLGPAMRAGRYMQLLLRHAGPGLLCSPLQRTAPIATHLLELGEGSHQRVGDGAASEPAGQERWRISWPTPQVTHAQQQGRPAVRCEWCKTCKPRRTAAGVQIWCARGAQQPPHTTICSRAAAPNTRRCAAVGTGRAAAEGTKMGAPKPGNRALTCWGTRTCPRTWCRSRRSRAQSWRAGRTGSRRLRAGGAGRQSGGLSGGTAQSQCKMASSVAPFCPE